MCNAIKDNMEAYGKGDTSMLDGALSCSDGSEEQVQGACANRCQAYAAFQSRNYELNYCDFYYLRSCIPYEECHEPLEKIVNDNDMDIIDLMEHMGPCICDCCPDGLQ